MKSKEGEVDFHVFRIFLFSFFFFIFIFIFLSSFCFSFSTHFSFLFDIHFPNRSDSYEHGSPGARKRLKSSDKDKDRRNSPDSEFKPPPKTRRASGKRRRKQKKEIRTKRKYEVQKSTTNLEKASTKHQKSIR